MRSLVVRERDRLELEDPDARLTEAEAETLSRLPLPPGAVTWERRAIQLGPFCGVLRVHDLTIEVLPKIRGVADGEDRGILIAMLRAAGHLPATLPNATGLEHQEQHLLDVFVLDFCAAVSALLSRGAIRSYEVHEDRLSALRGRLHLPEQLRRGLLDRTQLHCRYDELTADNAHNRALKAVLAALLGHARGSRAKAAVNVLLLCLDEVSVRPCRVADLEQLRFDRLTARWEPLFQRAIQLMRGLYPDVRAGQTVDGSCLLFDMQRLFEAFVGEHLRRAYHGRSERVVLQGPQRHLATGDRGKAFRMRPDMAVVSPDGQVERILDAKWKALDLTQAKAGVSQDDAYQMAAYASSYGCRRLALLYPSGDGLPAGRVDSFTLRVSGEPQVDIYALDIAALVGGQPLQADLTTSSSNPGLDREAA